jgi:hypothetical protein
MLPLLDPPIGKDFRICLDPDFFQTKLQTERLLNTSTYVYVRSTVNILLCYTTHQYSTVDMLYHA